MVMQLNSSRKHRNRCTLMIVLLILIIHLQKAYSNCPECYRTQEEQCVICYENCETFRFSSCTNSQGQLSQGACIAECCHDQQNHHVNSFTLESIKKCVSDQINTKNKFQSVGYFVVLIVGSCAVGILFIIILRQIYRRIMNRPSFQTRVVPHHFQHSVQQIQQNMVSENQESKQFPSNCNEIIKDDTNCCCICLDGDVSAITKCGHVFHLDCLVAWGNRKNSCPLCNYKNIQEAKIYCKKCKSYQRNANIFYIRYEQMDKLKNTGCQNCLK